MRELTMWLLGIIIGLMWGNAIEKQSSTKALGVSVEEAKDLRKECELPIARTESCTLVYVVKSNNGEPNAK